MSLFADWIQTKKLVFIFNLRSLVTNNSTSNLFIVGFTHQPCSDLSLLRTPLSWKSLLYLLALHVAESDGKAPNRTPLLRRCCRHIKALQKIPRTSWNLLFCQHLNSNQHQRLGAVKIANLANKLWNFEFVHFMETLSTFSAWSLFAVEMYLKRWQRLEMQSAILP